MNEDPIIYLAILNITSWSGQCTDATHVYGKLTLCDRAGVTIDNIEDYNVKYLGKGVNVQRPLTQELAKRLDEKDSGHSHQREFHVLTEHPEIRDKMEYYGHTERFDTFEEVVNAGIAKWKELDINCPFISLYEGDKYKANKYEPTSSIILKYEEKI